MHFGVIFLQTVLLVVLSNKYGECIKECSLSLFTIPPPVNAFVFTIFPIGIMNSFFVSTC